MKDTPMRHILLQAHKSNLRWGASSQPDFTCKNTKETGSWLVDSLEEWRKEKGLDKFVLMGHSLGGYVCSRYALKHLEHVEHLVLVGCAGFSLHSERMPERMLEFWLSWKGVIANAVGNACVVANVVRVVVLQIGRCQQVSFTVLQIGWIGVEPSKQSSL